MSDQKMPFQRLDSYVAARELARRIHTAKVRDVELRDQATRAAKSVSLNLCEGLPHEGVAMRRKYFATALGSLHETVGAIDLAAAIGAVDPQSGLTLGAYGPCRGRFPAQRGPCTRGTTMRIGIIGAGNIGGTLTRRLCALGHDVAVANSRGPETLAGLAAETGATAVTVRDAVRDRDLVIVTIPEKNIRDLPSDLFANVPASVVVVDTGNYYPRQRDGRIEEIESGMTESGWVARQLGRPVIKAFNNIYAEHLLKNGRPPGAAGRIALPVAGDDAAAKAMVMALVDALGFDAVDAGGLDESWRQQPGTPVYTKDFDADGVRRALAAARPERQAEWRGSTSSPGTFAAPR